VWAVAATVPNHARILEPVTHDSVIPIRVSGMRSMKRERILFWADLLAGSTNDYDDLFVVDAPGQIGRSSTTSRTGLQE